MSSPQADPRSAVKVGSRVRLRDGGEVEEFTIVGPEDVAPLLGRISSDCPLGRALLGRRVGETVRVRTPGGIRTVTVLQVERSPLGDDGR